MYSFDEFKMLAVLHLEKELKKQNDDVSVFTYPIRKINQELTAVTYNIAGAREGIRPQVYLEPMYEEYLYGGDVHEILDRITSLMLQATEETPNYTEQLKGYKEASDRIIFQLVNTEQNKELLEELPHREFQDLSIVYRWVVGMDENGMSVIQINDHLAAAMDLSEQELYELAYKNTRRILEPKIENMMDVFKTLGYEQSEEEQELSGMYIVSNSTLQDGAAMILYSDILNELSEKIGNDFYLLPSSRHEFLAVAKNEKQTPDILQAMVYDINFSLVRPEDRLSNQVYQYNSNLQQIMQVTFDERTRLDADVPEWARNSGEEDEAEEFGEDEVEAPVMQM